MNYSLSNRHTTWHIRATFFIMAVALSFAWTTNIVRADAKTSSQLSVASSGQVIVKDAIVNSVSADTIRATSAWGALSIEWLITTTGSTRFQPSASSSEVALGDIKPGDTISFSGNIDSSASRPTVIASVVKNTSIQRDSVTTRGAVISIDPKQNTFIISASSGTTTVRTNTGTIMTLDGNLATLSDMQLGTEIDIIGNMNMATHTVVAQRMSWQTPAESVSDARVGRILSFFNWLMGSRGALSLMGR